MPEETEHLSAFAYTQAVILFQIAELHRMKDKELHNEMRSFGITSETGYDWYNFNPLDLLECGARGLCDYIGEDETIPNDWHFNSILTTGIPFKNKTISTLLLFDTE